MSDKWISVDDKLPSNERVVLGYQRIYGYVITRYQPGIWLDVEDGGATALSGQVTHWRELPPSPTEEAGNE